MTASLCLIPTPVRHMKTQRSNPPTANQVEERWCSPVWKGLSSDFLMKKRVTSRETAYGENLSLEHKPTSHKYSIYGSSCRYPRNPHGTFSSVGNGKALDPNLYLLMWKALVGTQTHSFLWNHHNGQTRTRKSWSERPDRQGYAMVHWCKLLNKQQDLYKELF